MTSQLTRERLQEIAEDGFLKHGESKKLARMARAYIEMCDQMTEIAKCLLVIDDIREIIRILNDRDWNDTDGFRGIQTDIGKELESVIDGLIDQIKPSLSPRPGEIKKYFLEALIEKGLYDGLRLALNNAGIAAPESDQTLIIKQDLYVQELILWVKDRKSFQPAPVVPEKCPADIRDLIASHSDALFNDDDAQGIWNACRAAILAAAPQEVKDGK